jgi:hypothetical protein
MKLYADRPAQLANQLTGDLLLAGWVLLWIWAGKQLYDLIAALAVPGQKAEAAGRSLERSLGDAAKNVGDLPLAGDELRKPFDGAAASGRDLADAAQSYQDSVHDLALLAGSLVAIAPILVVLSVWLPRRLAWIRDASAATRLMRTDPGALDLLALRALAARPLHELAATVGEPTDLVSAWRSGDREVVDRLARVELAALGMRPRLASDGSTT